MRNNIVHIGAGELTYEIRAIVEANRTRKDFLAEQIIARARDEAGATQNSSSKAQQEERRSS